MESVKSQYIKSEEKHMLKIECEGTDGAGKTTALKYFVEEAKKRGISVTETREVGNPHIAACIKLRELVLNPENKLSGEAMELIFGAMRYENDRWLKTINSQFVVSDRGWLSHLAYTDHNVSTNFTKRVYEDFLALETSLPDVVIYFDVNTETALQRRNNRGTSDVIEMKGVSFQEKVRSSFEKYIERYSGLIKVFIVNANGTIDEVRQELDQILNRLDIRSL
jgi:dTMP kinase